MIKIIALCSYFTGLYLVFVVMGVVIAGYQRIAQKMPFFSELKGLNPFLFGKAFSEDHTKQMIAGTIITAMLTLGILNEIIPNTALGSEKIGGLFEKHDYHTYYYVLLFPEDASSKNYKVIAEIWADGGDYTLERAYFPNKGYITFEDTLFSADETVDLSQKIYMRDDEGTSWDVQLLNEKPSIAKIKEFAKQE